MNFVLQDRDNSVIGELKTVRSEYKDTLLDIARANELGYQEIKLVNPVLDTWLPGDDQEVMLPMKYVLPLAPQNGIVINIPEMRLYYFPFNSHANTLEVITYPLGIGKEGWNTPYVDTKIIEKKERPYWYPPKSIREEHQAAGDPLPARVAPGPDNPLGDYALRLGLHQYLLHGTNKPYGVGMRVSHGCIRLYPEHIKKLFERVELGTPVYIVNQPYKIGWRDGSIYLEAHPFLQEDADVFEDNLTSVVRTLVKVTAGRSYQINWKLAKRVINEMKGIPVQIGEFTETPLLAKTVEGEQSRQKSENFKLRLETRLLKATQ